MKQIFYTLLISLGLTFGSASGGDSIIKVSNPTEVKVEVSNSRGLPKELEGLVWNRWTSENFVVCSLDDTQAQYLHKHLELVKVWVFARWGMYDIDFSAQCKLICVNNKDLFKKLFNIEATKVEIRKDKNNKIVETIIFLLIDGPPSQTIPMPLTEVCLAEFSQKYNADFGLWTYRGMANLNGTVEHIKSNILEIKAILDKNEPLYFSKGVLETTLDQYKALPEDRKRLFDNCATMFCLMVRKEFGQEAYLKFLKEYSDGKREEAIQSILKFSDYNSFDKNFKRYMIDLTREVSEGKTPISYLQINEFKNKDN